MKEKDSVIDPRAKTSRYRYLMVVCDYTAGMWSLFLESKDRAFCLKEMVVFSDKVGFETGLNSLWPV